MIFKNIKDMRVFRVAANCYDFDIWVLGKVFLTSWPLWAKLAQNFTSLPVIKPAAQRFRHKVFVRFSHESHAHEGWLPQHWIYAQICWENDVKDKTVNGRTDMKPTLTWWAASECVMKKKPCAPNRRGPTEVRQSFYRVVAWERKESLFNIKLFPIQP